MKTNFIFFKFILSLLFILFLNFKVFSLEVTLTQGTVKPTPIAITDFFSNENTVMKIGKNILLKIQVGIKLIFDM